MTPPSLGNGPASSIRSSSAEMPASSEGRPPSPHFLARIKSRLGIPFGWKVVGGLLATAAAVLLAFVFILRPNATDSPGVDPTALVTAEERELLEYLDVAENYDVVQALEVLIDKAETEGGQIFFPSGGEEK